VVAQKDQPFIRIVVQDTDAKRAAAVANAYAKVLPTVLQQLKQTNSVESGVISVLEPAGVPSSAYSPRPRKNLMIGAVIGLVLGLGAAFVREALDRRLRDSDDVEKASGVNVLGVVPDDLEGVRTPVATHPMSARAEAYRKVRTNLSFVSQEGTPKSILITSATSGEGKTTLATNLALACARTGQRVVIVDCDLRRPMVADNYDIPSQPGITDVLSGRYNIDKVLQRIDEGRVSVIASGPIPGNPSEILGSDRMLEVLRQLERNFDIVILDAPPVLPVADALVLAVHVDAVVLVTRVGETTRDRLRRAKDAIIKVRGNLVGVVPNAVVQREDSAYAYAYRYRSRDGEDSLKLYTKKARQPELDEVVPDRPAPIATAKANGSGRSRGLRRTPAAGRDSRPSRTERSDEAPDPYTDTQV
jgi:non-specific protein-tyrosine kinase